MKTKMFAVLVLLSLVLSACAAAAPVVETPAPTQVIVESTPIPTEIASPVSCDTPSIMAGLNAANTEMGEYLDTNLGERMTFTSRRLLVPEKQWNDPLTATELNTVEETWQFMQVCIPDGMSGRVFAGGFVQGVNRYENGVLMTLNPGLYEFKMRNGEVVIWYPNQQSFADDDLVRIIEQIKVGNFDIKAPLAFFGVTTDLLPQIPSQLVKDRNVQIVSFPTKSK